jgi:hypothetical protein
MHRIFEHHDILSALVSRIAESSPHGHPVFTNNTLHVLSLTNRLIGEHALDALWAECSLWRLAMLMPAEIWLVVEEESEPPDVDDLFEISDEVYVLVSITSVSTPNSHAYGFLLCCRNLWMAIEASLKLSWVNILSPEQGV